MQEMIKEYEKSRALVLSRVQELTARLREKTLGNKERDALLARRELLWEESTDLSHAIRDMSAHLQEGGSRDRKGIRKGAGVRQRVSGGDQRRKQHEPKTPQHRVPGAQRSDPDRPDTQTKRSAAAVLS